MWPGGVGTRPNFPPNQCSATYRGAAHNYDNLKSAVIERQGDAIRFNATLLAFANHHRFEPRPVAVARGNEKGRVERAIRYVRDNFLAARTITDLETLNQEAEAWSRGPAVERRCPGHPDRCVRDALAEEAPLLLPLPNTPFPLVAAVPARIGRFKPLCNFDWTWPRKCERAAIDDLMSLAFLQDATNAVLIGPNGVGKSTLAQNIAYHTRAGNF